MESRARCVLDQVLGEQSEIHDEGFRATGRMSLETNAFGNGRREAGHGVGPESQPQMATGCTLVGAEHDFMCSIRALKVRSNVWRRPNSIARFHVSSSVVRSLFSSAIFSATRFAWFIGRSQPAPDSRTIPRNASLS